jgi:hypothetical protein
MDQPLNQIPPDQIPPIEILRLSTYLKKNLIWGTVTIEVKNGKPVMITHATKDVKLTDK